MIIKYGADIDLKAINSNIKRLTNQIFKLLPNREEGADWQRPLENIIEELAGMDSLLFEDHEKLFPLLCKLEGLFRLTKEEDFQLYRRTVFESLNLLEQIRKGIGG